MAGVRFECDECGKTYSHKKTLYRHISLKHMDNGKFECSACCKKYCFKHELRTHISLKHTVKKNHKKNDRKFKCNECGKKYDYRKTLYRHVSLKHRDTEKFGCPACGKKYNFKHELRTHISLKHTVETNYETNDGKFKCDECGKTYGYKKTLYRHILLKHLDSEKFECSTCCKKYTFKQDLRNHISLKHTARKNYENAKKFTCDECGNKYDYKKTLYRHILLKHSDDEKFICSECASKDDQQQYDRNFECHECGKKYFHKRCLTFHMTASHSRNIIKCKQCGEECKGDLKWHIRLRHSAKLLIERRTFTCLLCHKSLSSEFHILNHFQNAHQLEIITENHSFESELQFIIWKSDIQKLHNCRYIKKKQYKNAKTNKMTKLFRCNRSGFYTPLQQGRQRKLKTQGSKKLNGFCPSKILVYSTGDGVQTVVFTKSHVGHSNDYEEPPQTCYTREEKKKILEEMRSGAPISRIVRETVPRRLKQQGSLRKINLLNEEDIGNTNITASRQRSSVKNPHLYHSDDVIAVEAWVSANKESVYFYKRQGEADRSEYKLHENDFALVFMNTEQREKFQRYSSNVVFVEGTHAICKGADFLLHTVVVEDEYGEAYPTCFLITNLNNAVIFDIMFSCIRKQFGVIHTNVFMSDMENSYQDSWIRIMGVRPKHHFYCAWHVTRAWQKNYAKVKLPEKKKALSQRLQRLLREENVVSFHRLLEEFLTDNDDDLQPFIDYFSRNYTCNYEKWAFCYRELAGANTDLKIERYHGMLKYGGGRGLTISQLQDTLIHLEKLSFKKNRSDKRAKVMGEKQCFKIQELTREHIKAIPYLNSCEITQVDERSWKIVSLSHKENKNNEDEEEPKSYVLEKINDSCPHPNCRLLCTHCYFCHHQFRCSCPLNAVRNIMCKHIHLLCMTKLLNIETIDSAIVDTDEEDNVDGVEVISDCSQTDMMVASVEEVFLEPLPALPSETSSSPNRKQQLLDDLTELVEKAQADERKYFILNKLIKKISTTFDAMESDSCSTSCSTVTPEKGKKKIL